MCDHPRRCRSPRWLAITLTQQARIHVLACRHAAGLRLWCKRDLALRVPGKTHSAQETAAGKEPYSAVCKPIETLPQRLRRKKTSEEREQEQRQRQERWQQREQRRQEWEQEQQRREERAGAKLAKRLERVFKKRRKKKDSVS
jgi:hypothetical protein